MKRHVELGKIMTQCCNPQQIRAGYGVVKDPKGYTNEDYGNIGRLALQFGDIRPDGELN